MTLAIQSWSDAIVITAVLVINGTIGFIQEYRAESAVQSLMEMISPQAKVRRDGHEQAIDSSDLVPGDIVSVGQGEMVPADLRLLEAEGLQIDEAALTGESVPVSKQEEALQDAEPDLTPADQKNMAFMGTAATSGRAVGVVVATGQDTQIGEIAESVQEAGDTSTPLQQRIRGSAEVAPDDEATSAPALASATAIAAPSPREAPVTTAHLPCKEND